jgi:Tfp pilus assembly protein PilF
MRIWIRLFITGLLSVCWAGAAEPHWIRMHSLDFEIYSTASEKSTRETLHQFEQVRDFFTQTMGVDASRSTSLRIVVFGSKKEYNAYRPNDFAAAYYLPTPDRDYIVLGGTGADVFPVAVHEYVHLVTQHAGMNFPPWLNEGVAELYSTLKPYAGKVLVGSLIPRRFQGLMVDKWVPLATILSADRNSPYYNEKDKAGSLYNEGWALTHMLTLSPAYRAGYSNFIAAIRKGADSADALGMVYGKPLSDIEKDLIIYLHGGRFQGVLFPVKIEKQSDAAPAEAVSPIDVQLTLVDLIHRPGREDEVEKRLRDLMAQDPQRPEPYVALGYLELGRQKREEGQQDFQKAFALGSRDARMLFDYGRLVAGENRPEAIRVLSRLLMEEPEKMEARLDLAGLQLSERQAQDALQTLRPVRTVTPQDAPRFFKMMAYAQAEAGNTDQARSAAQRWADTARSPADRDEAGRYQKYLTSFGPGSNPSAAFSSNPPQDAAPPKLAKKDAAVATLPPPLRPNWPSVTGSLIGLKCNGTEATVVLKIANGTQTFLIQDPTRVHVDGPRGSTVDLTCGPQPGVPVKIEFEPPGAEQTVTSGFVRAIHFLAGSEKPK